MGNGCSKKKGLARKLTLAIVGLDNAGKTVTTKGLQGESVENVAPTIGFSNVDFKFDGNDITLFDLGGGKKIRDIWKSYFSEIYALLFVVDSSDVNRMDECKYVMSNLLDHPQMKGKPILVLANKQDQDGAMDEIDICENLNLEELVNMYKCPCRVETCSAILGHGKKQDPAIRKGMTWLLQTVDKMWDKLHERVTKDVSEKKEREDQERAEKRERVRKIREERDRKEKAERKLRGEEEVESDQDIPDGGDPFQRLSYDKIAKKEQKLKAEKKRKKELESQQLRRTSAGSDEEDYHPRLSRRTPRQISDDDDDDDDDDEEIPHQNAIKSTLSPKDNMALSNGSRFPNRGQSQLGPSPRFGRKLDPIQYNGEDSDETEPSSKLNGRSPRPLSDLKPMPSLTPRGGQGLEPEGRMMGRRGLAPLAPLAPLEPLESGKKKKAKKNQTVPLASENDEEVDNYQPKTSPFAQRGWNTPPGQRSLLKVSRTPGLETLKEPDTERSESDNMNSFSSKWGLDLPDLAPSSRGNLRPNYDYDHDIVT